MATVVSMKNNRVLLSEEERIKRIRNSQNIYKNKDWYCDICNDGHNYRIACKSSHVRSKRHLENAGLADQYISRIANEEAKLKCYFHLYGEWYCEDCNNGYNYKRNGKTTHIKSKKHQNNIRKRN